MHIWSSGPLGAACYLYNDFDLGWPLDDDF